MQSVKTRIRRGMYLNATATVVLLAVSLAVWPVAVLILTALGTAVPYLSSAAAQGRALVYGRWAWLDEASVSVVLITGGISGVYPAAVAACVVSMLLFPVKMLLFERFVHKTPDSVLEELLP